MAGRVDFVSDGGVATVTLDSPGKLNAVSVAMWQGLARIFNEIGDAESLRVIVIRGANGNFAAGADIEEFERVRHDPSSGRQYHLETIGNALTAIDRCPVPLVAAIEGVCVGGGLEVASLRHSACGSQRAVRCADRPSRIPVSAARLVPLLRLRARAAELLLKASAVSEERDARAHYACRRCQFTEVNCSCALRTLQRIAARCRQNKANIRRFQSRGWITQHELDASFAFLDSHDYHEGVRAFLAKRSPNFLGK